MKKAAALLCIVVMSFSLLTGCGGAKDKKEETKATTESQSDSESEAKDETTANSDSKGAAAVDFKEDAKYLTWTQKEWEAASDEEKNNCLYTYFVEFYKMMGQEFTENEKNSLVETLSTDNQTVRAQLDSAFEANPGMNITEILAEVKAILETAGAAETGGTPASESSAE